MTITMSNHKVERNIVNKAMQLAAKSDENAVIYEASIGKSKQQLVATVSQYENRPADAEIELIATVDKDGKFVD